MGAALEDALRQRSGGAEEDSDGGLSLTDVIADLQSQTGGDDEAEDEHEDEDGS